MDAKEVVGCLSHCIDCLLSNGDLTLGDDKLALEVAEAAKNVQPQTIMRIWTFRYGIAT